MIDPRHDPEAALAAMREARSRPGPQATVEQAREFLSRPKLLGWNVAPKFGRAYHRIIRMPDARLSARKTRRKAGDPTREAVVRALDALVRERGTVRVDHRLVSAVWNRIPGLIARKTVERHLRALLASVAM